uniref:Uncharacterized protein MANES_05G179100 n=1 Tax=Rhizophora mucronata TaxID=61149 RepID=A0A2P2IWB4_RHIMU
MFFNVLILFLVLYVLTNHFLNKIRNLPPSPFPTLPIIGHLHLVKKPLHRSLAKISSRHGPVLLLQLASRRVLLVSSPSAADECFTKNDVIFANRPRLLASKHFGYNFTSLVWAPYGEVWRNLRKISSVELLSANRLHLLSKIRSDEVRLLIRRLFRHQDQTVDLNSAFFGLMLNVMMRMIAGKRYYGEDVTEDTKEVRMFQELVAETFQLGSSIADFLPGWLVAIGGAEKRFVECQRKRDRFIQNLIEEQRKRMKSDGPSDSGNRNKTLIEVLLSLQESEPEFYKDEVIRSLVLVRCLCSAI